MPNSLDPATVLALLPTLLPVSNSSPLAKPTDALAALIHAIHTALDFRIVQPQTTQAGPSASAAQPQTEENDFDDTASETTTAVDQEEAEASNVENRLGSEWNARGEETYTFEYRHERSSLTFRIRVGRMGGRIQVDGMAEDGAPNTISILITEILNPSAFPVPGSDTASGSNSSSPEAPAKNLGFQSIASVSRFIDQYKRDIIAKILPGLQKDGYVEAPAPSGSGPRNPPPAQPAHNPPARPDPLIDPFNSGRYQPPGQHPASIGHRDLDPFASMHPPGSFNPLGDGGGMLMGPNHPLFADRRRQDPPFGGGGGPEGFHPPGARWDPVGPGVPGNPDGRFPGPGGNPLGGVGVGDDRWGDEMPPPGEFGPDLGRMGGGGRGRGGPGGPGGLGGMPGMGPGGFGPRFGGGGGGGMGGGFGGGGGGMYM